MWRWSSSTSTFTSCRCDSTQTIPMLISMCFPDQDAQGIGDNDFSTLPISAAALLWRHLHGSLEAVMSARGLPVQHTLRLHLSQDSFQDESIKPELRRPLPRQVTICLWRHYYPLLYCDPFQKLLLVSVYDYFNHWLWSYPTFLSHIQITRLFRYDSAYFV